MSEAVPTLYEKRCPRCGSRGAYAGAVECAPCGVALAVVPAERTPDVAPQVFVYRPWVVWLLAAAAVAAPFVPLPFLGGIAGLGLKLAVSAALIKIIRDYREGMR